MGTALLFISARRDDKPRIAGAVLMRQLLQTATALRDYHVATRTSGRRRPSSGTSSTGWRRCQ
jgi:hypothetical protein